MQKDYFLVSLIETLYTIAFRLLMIFGLIFLYQNFKQSIWHTVLPFITIYGLYALLVPFSSHLVGRMNTRSALIVSLFLFTFSAYFLSQYGKTQEINALIAWASTYLGAKLFFHPALVYSEDESISPQNRSVIISLKHVLLITAFIITPVIGGFLSEGLGLIALGTSSMVIFLAATIPALYGQRRTFQVNKKVIRQLLAERQIQQLVFIDFMSAIPNAITLLWPIYIFYLLENNFVYVGIFLAVASLVAMGLVYLSGKFLKDNSPIIFLQKTYLGVSFAWLLKFLFSNIYLLGFADTLHKVFNRLTDSSVEIVDFDLMNDHIRKNDHDETMIIHEVALSSGNAFAYAVAALCINTFTFRSVFLLAAFSSLFFLFVKDVRKNNMKGSYAKTVKI